MDKKAFIREMNALLGQPLSDRGTKRIQDMLDKYRQANGTREVEKIVYVEKLVIKPVNCSKRVVVTPEKIISIISSVTGITLQKMRSSSKKREIVWARQLYFYFTRKYTNLGYRQISQYMRGEDHSTVIHDIGVVNNLKYLYEDMINDIDQQILSAFYSNGTLEIPFGKLVVDN